MSRHRHTRPSARDRLYDAEWRELAQRIRDEGAGMVGGLMACAHEKNHKHPRYYLPRRINNMAHHSGPDEKDLNDMLRAEFGKQDSSDDIASFMEQLRPRLGATQNFPEAPISEDDEGEIRIGITATGGNVILGFGKHIDWIGFLPEQARALAQSLLDKAEQCDGIQGVVRRV